MSTLDGPTSLGYVALDRHLISPDVRVGMGCVMHSRGLVLWARDTSRVHPRP